MSGIVILLSDLLQGFHSCTVIVKETVDAFIAAQRIECLGNIGNRVQNHVVLSVEIGELRTAFKPLDFEERCRRQAEALERAKLLNEQAEQLKKEADRLGNQ